MTSAPWWKGTRGEWYVVAQFAIFALILLGPRTLPGSPPWGPALSSIATVVGLALMVAGAALSLAGLIRLGPNLSVLPLPKDCAELVDTGAYGIVRHPIYSGLIMGAFGYGLWVHGVLTLLWAAALFALFDVKSRLEERWLSQKFPRYADYRRRVKKLVPWIY